VPVTARLSKKFYERLGEDVTNELVDWFNAVDATYQNQLREQNDRNFECFSTELRAELSILRSEFTGKLDSEIANLRADLIKWMFVFWAGTIIPLAGLEIALHIALQP
jgi:hypothetical protein